MCGNDSNLSFALRVAPVSRGCFAVIQTFLCSWIQLSYLQVMSLSYTRVAKGILWHIISPHDLNILLRKFLVSQSLK